MISREYDVAVVGAGPAGSAAAAAAAREGLRVALIDRGDFPRSRVCAGALTPPAYEFVGPRADAIGAEDLTNLAFSYRGGVVTLKQSERPYLRIVDRAQLDDLLVADAIDAGADLLTPVEVASVDQDAEGVVLGTNHGLIAASYVIAADGATGRLGHYVGIEHAREDLGVVLTLDPGELLKAWEGRAHLDFGPVPGSMGWVVPSGDFLQVGVFAARDQAAEARKYLWRLMQWQRIDWMPIVSERGQITHVRTDGSALSHGRVLAVGESAGLVDAWTRDGIAFALRSGDIAGSIAAHGVISGASVDEVEFKYEAALSLEVLPEVSESLLALHTLETRPVVVHQLATRTNLGWRDLRRVMTDDTAVARIAHTGDVEGIVAVLMAQWAPSAVIDADTELVRQLPTGS